MFVQDPTPYLRTKVHYMVVLLLENNNLQLRMVYKLKPMFLKNLSYHLFLKNQKFLMSHLFLKNQKFLMSHLFH